jgi:hypothetical protein
MEEFDNLKMEHAFTKAKLMIYQKRNKKSQTNNGSYIRNKLVKLFERHLNPIRKTRSCTSCVWRPTCLELIGDATFGDVAF